MNEPTASEILLRVADRLEKMLTPIGSGNCHMQYSDHAILMEVAQDVKILLRAFAAHLEVAAQ